MGVPLYSPRRNAGDTSLLSTVEKSRLRISKATESRKKSKLGQFFTPARIAQFMAELFVQTTGNNCRLLDAGAGIGSLSAAFLERLVSGGFDFKRVELDAFEIDETLHPYLTRTDNRGIQKTNRCCINYQE